MLGLQALLVLLMVAGGLALAIYEARARSTHEAAQRALGIARSVADSPAVVQALDSPDPSARLQPFAEQVRRDTGVDFVVVMSPDRVRYTHPDTRQIGGRFLGGLGDAPLGATFTEEYTGTLGPSMRAVVPVTDGTSVRALVSVGIGMVSIQAEVWRAVTAIGLAALGVLAVGAVGVLLISRRLARATHGLTAGELTRMYEYHQAVLWAVREGLVLLDSAHRVQLVNDEARRLLDLPADVVGARFADLDLPPALVEAALGDRSQADDVYLVDGNALVVSAAPARRDGRTVGAVVTVRDRTELQAVSGELDVVRRLTDSLRAQNHESANRLHTVVSLVEMGHVEEAIDVATEEIQVAQLLADSVLSSVDDPVLTAVLLGKSAEAAERGVALEVHGDVRDTRVDVDSRSLVTVTGNLVDNALDALTDVSDARIDVEVRWDATQFVIAVGDNGPGIPEADVASALQRGWSTKAGPPGSRGIGLALVAQIAARCGGQVQVTRSPAGGALVTVTLRRRS